MSTTTTTSAREPGHPRPARARVPACVPVPALLNSSRGSHRPASSAIKAPASPAQRSRRGPGRLDVPHRLHTSGCLFARPPRPHPNESLNIYGSTRAPTCDALAESLCSGTVVRYAAKGSSRSSSLVDCLFLSWAGLYPARICTLCAGRAAVVLSSFPSRGFFPFLDASRPPHARPRARGPAPGHRRDLSPALRVRQVTRGAYPFSALPRCCPCLRPFPHSPPPSSHPSLHLSSPPSHRSPAPPLRLTGLTSYTPASSSIGTSERFNDSPWGFGTRRRKKGEGDVDSRCLTSGALRRRADGRASSVARDELAWGVWLRGRLS
ncbi:hypothetical protein C8R44DRAFT_987106 [Mycena epipterygia]|nr:hypothetical protein C8R44DRAFT_987106 [Mycena epipterygia]